MIDFFALSLKDLEEWLASHGLARAHGKTLFRYIYKHLRLPQTKEVELPKALLARWQTSFKLASLVIHKEQHSAYDGSVKFVFSLDDGSLIESVLMPEKSRLTLCLSSQVGCRQGCTFCHTGRMGLKRHLSAGEIIAQLMTANRWLAAQPSWLEGVRLPAGQQVSNVVFMGMGEPLDNVAAVSQALRIMKEPFGLNLAPKRVTVSTAGHLEGLKALLQEDPQLALALSVHSADMRERSQLVPLNRRFPLAEVLAFLRSHCQGKRKHIMIQYTMIDGVNDSLEHAEKLADLLQGLSVKVNLIPLNPIAAVRFNASQPSRLKSFQEFLLAAGLRTMVRYSKGQDIAAACGQLITPLSQPLAAL